LALPPLDVPADPLVGRPTGRVFIVEPLEDPMPPSDLGGAHTSGVAHRPRAAATPRATSG
jgi:hypothetical protein